jgi:hypothetical protein
MGPGVLLALGIAITTLWISRMMGTAIRRSM